MSAKGVVYARILKTNTQGIKQVFNVFGTHMQAWDSVEAANTRLKQQQSINTFIDSLNIPKSEPIIIAGDFNVD